MQPVDLQRPPADPGAPAERRPGEYLPGGDYAPLSRRLRARPDGEGPPEPEPFVFRADVLARLPGLDGAVRGAVIQWLSEDAVVRDAMGFLRDVVASRAAALCDELAIPAEGLDVAVRNLLA